jgi:hypothetical protein
LFHKKILSYLKKLFINAFGIFLQNSSAITLHYNTYYSMILVRAELVVAFAATGSAAAASSTTASPFSRSPSLVASAASAVAPASLRVDTVRRGVVLVDPGLSFNFSAAAAAAGVLLAAPGESDSVVTLQQLRHQVRVPRR